MDQVLIGVSVIAGLAALFFLIGEVSLWFHMRCFRSEDPAFRDEARKRLRRAFYDGATSIGWTQHK